jgi:N-acetylglucosamine malate deacetylase 2
MHRPPGSASTVGAILAALAAHRTVTERVMVAAAHPDDETIGIGAQLCRLADLLMVHVTDGAPRDGHDAEQYGFATAAAYAAARRTELTHALAAGEAHSAQTLAFDIPDQQSWRDLAALARRLAELIASEAPKAVVTHSYEGGHPDHDATSFAMHAACCLLPGPSAPAIIEMALYHRRNGQCVKGQFLELPSRRRPGSADPLPARFKSGSRFSPGQFEGGPTVLLLDADDVARKRRMIDCFTTQRWLLAEFPLDSERLRVAPAYDFRAPPHPGTLHYETLGWGITGVEWRRAADAALTELGLASLPCL